MRQIHLKRQQITSVSDELIIAMVAQSLVEDLGSGDINALLINKKEQASAKVITRQKMVMCGRKWVEEVFRQVDSTVAITWHFIDGDEIASNEVIFEVRGCARSILSAERNALNFLQMLSAVATQTQAYVHAVNGTSCQILDTRKTIPGFRLAQKYAVACGGGMNHRIGLFDAFLIKENHIMACDNSISKAVENAHNIAPGKMIEVEVENFIELEQALDAKADVVMLDNFSLEQMTDAVKIVAEKSDEHYRAQLEASGNVSLQTIADISKTGVDFISVGALTKNIEAIDLSMRFV